MARCMVTLLVLAALASSCHGSYYRQKTTPARVPLHLNQGLLGPGEPLILTPYLESGDVKGAQKAAKVKPLFGNVKSYSGFFTVNKAMGSNMFFWYFPAENNADTAPVVLWLQGGPGATSLYGLFSENGPYIAQGGKLSLREYSWSKNYNVIYIDNPVGTGYSFTEKDEGYARNETQVGRDLHSAVQQFFQMFPKLQGREFFITGESYAGKYVPALGYHIHRNQDPSQPINLQGLFIGNGLTDPVNMLLYSEYLFQHGLVDDNGRAQLKQYEDKMVKLIRQERYMDAFKVFDLMLNGDLTPYPTLFKNLTGFDFYFDYLYTSDPDTSDGLTLVQKPEVRRKLHVGNATWHDGMVVEQHLMEDVVQSVAPWVAELLDHYRVMVYNGQLDIIVAYPLTDNYLTQLKWSGRQEFLTAPRKQWLVDNELAGYVKTAGKLTQVMVRDAGHMVPYDQPRRALDLLDRFIANTPF